MMEHGWMVIRLIIPGKQLVKLDACLKTFLGRQQATSATNSLAYAHTFFYKILGHTQTSAS